METKKTTDTLKGIAIFAVLTNHYLNLNIEGDFLGYANLWVSIFFILSGYGLFYSSNKNIYGNDNSNIIKKYLKFLLLKFIRLFPLLWIAWFVEILIRKGRLSLWIPLGIHGNEHYWFIPALLQCYIISPMIIYIVKYKCITLAILLTFGILFFNLLYINNYLPNVIVKIASFANTDWRGIFFLHILFFAFGYLTAFYFNSQKSKINYERTKTKIQFWIFTIIIIYIMHILKNVGVTFPIKFICFTLIPLIMIFLLFIFSLNYSIKSFIFSFLGRLSYSLYLFHMSFFLIVNDVGKFGKNSIEELTLCIGLFPIFLVFIYYIEKFGLFTSNSIKKLLSI